ncbi:hypothetical protein K469DRAFT_710450 [Zopfia rhizophila CBS 207.26]|uniref:Tc1-like transposase DDE domain-containing protein n=1 Tax=Zopfia rhizophila CBS 207.26 TaxID=1314779 RepID=A0A6A6DZL7_9PEZI|nr:hypothetical protein K469DRAFT_710450 [Zopfia rhizophila CBS 207.26]
MNYHKCIACQKAWVNKSTAKDRVEWAKAALQVRLEPEDWHIVRFSDEVHWAIDEKTEGEKKIKRIHAWAAVGWDFKSPLTFYNIASNTNGKMTQRAYIDQILEPIVKSWIESHQCFILEEDGDSGHGPGKSNIVRTWKKENGLQYYFNCYSSPDLSVIENCWQPPKQYVKKFPHWDEQDTRELAIEGWEKVNQKFINASVNSMPQRLKDVIEMDRQMTGH